jgi:hypothetical protein
MQTAEWYHLFQLFLSTNFKFEMPTTSSTATRIFKIQLFLESKSNGRVFLANHKDLENGETPTKHAARDHPFRKFWQDHLKALTSPGLYDSVVDALIALALGKDDWRVLVSTDEIVEHRTATRKLLQDHPPNLAIVADVPTDSGYFGVHYRQSSLWQFICVNELYVNGWFASTVTRTTTGRKLDLLSYATLLDAVIDHELSHWLITLASNFPYQISILTEIWFFFMLQKYGYQSKKFLSALEIEDKDEREAKLGQIKNLEKGIEKHTLKAFQTKWNVTGEAGNYMEMRSRGGIIGYERNEGLFYIFCHHRCNIHWYFQKPQ